MTASRIKQAVFGVVLGLILFMPEICLAAPWDSYSQKLVDSLRGPLGVNIATIGLMAAAIMAYFGRIAWHWVGGVLVGILLFFGAPSIVAFFSSAVS